ncbi:MAG: response regulator RpfG family c-di-GMP phosphodiesterase [Paraglaciecola sp.]|jgi:response regulator RpfG family c-di-GMP phosphodiesterase
MQLRTKKIYTGLNRVGQLSMCMATHLFLSKDKISDITHPVSLFEIGILGVDTNI